MFLAPSTKFDSSYLLDNLKIFQKEYEQALSSNSFLDYSSVETGTKDMIDKPVNQNHEWQVYPLWYKFNPWPHKEYLETIEILKKLQVTPLQAAFSKLLPNTLLPWHEDHDESTVDRNDTTVIKYHLTLTESDSGSCGLENLDESRILKVGDLNIFDESETHRAYNYSDQERGVLLISFLRSDIF